MGANADAEVGLERNATYKLLTLANIKTNGDREESLLTRWMLRDFKPIAGKLELDLGNITVLAGLNSSGKSSILQSILLISQTLANPNREKALILNGNIVQLGTFEGVRNERSNDSHIEIGFGLLPSTRRISTSEISEIAFQANFQTGSARSNDVSGIEAVKVKLTESTLSIQNRDSSPLFSSNPDSGRELRVKISAISEEEPKDSSEEPIRIDVPGENYKAFISEVDSPVVAIVNHFLPEQFATKYDLNPERADSNQVIDRSDFARMGYSRTIIRSAIQHIITFFTTMVRYLGPLRADPQAPQRFAPSNEPDDVGIRGEFAAAVYEANKNQVIQWWHPTEKKLMNDPLARAIDVWTGYLGIAHHVSTREAGLSGVSWSVQHLPASQERPLQSVGVGVSQVLPILVAGLLAPIGGLILIEQPELHLHPRAQARLGDFFIALARVGKQCIIETHSDCLVNQFRLRMVEEGDELRNRTRIYFAAQDDEGKTLFEPISISPRGNIINWPEGFFDESLQQEDAITRTSLSKLK